MHKFIIFLLVTINAYGDDFKSNALELLKPVKKAFMGELKAGLQSGPYEAIDSCHLKAPHLVEHDKSDKYNVGRTALKVRNKENAPKTWMKEILNDYKSSTAKSPKAAKVYQVKNKKVYVEPIYIKPLCLNCHGKKRGSVFKKLSKLYPDDEAFGYDVGDFRGLFYVKEK